MLKSHLSLIVENLVKNTVKNTVIQSIYGNRTMGISRKELWNIRTAIRTVKYTNRNCEKIATICYVTKVIKTGVEKWRSVCSKNPGYLGLVEIPTMISSLASKTRWGNWKSLWSHFLDSSLHIFISRSHPFDTICVLSKALFILYNLFRRVQSPHQYPILIQTHVPLVYLKFVLLVLKAYGRTFVGQQLWFHDIVDPGTNISKQLWYLGYLAICFVFDFEEHLLIEDSQITIELARGAR